MQVARVRIASCVVAVAIFACFTAFYVLLRTQDYLAVDGALRCLSVYWHPRLIVGENNHLFYYVNSYLWAHALSALGVTPTSPLDYLREIHWMHAMAAAGCVSMLWLLCLGATDSLGVSLAAASIYAFSRAFLLHATSTSEPMLGLFWSFASVSAVASGLAASSRLRLIAGGAFLLLAMATYESMVLIGPAELFLIWKWNNDGLNRNRTFAAWFTTGCALGWIAAYVPAYALSGATTPIAILHRFFYMGPGNAVFGGFAAAKPLNLVMGFSNSIFPSLPPQYEGVRWMLHTHILDRQGLVTFGALGVVATWLVLTIKRLIVVWDSLEYRQRLILGCCAIALAFDLLALIFWDPIYDKLWMQPLAVIVLAWSVIFSAWNRHSRPRLMLVPETLFLLAICSTGFLSALRARTSPTPCLTAAHELAERMRPGDLLVGGWDPVWLLYSALWSNGANAFDVPTIAAGNGLETTKLLDDEIARTRASGGQVYFVGILDLPEKAWTPFLGNKTHFPYHSLDSIRQCVRPVATLTCSAGDERLWNLPRDCASANRTSALSIELR